MLKKIAVTGPECSGKTTLCKALSSHYQCFWVPEMARIILEKDGISYNARKVEDMARMQLKEEQRMEKSALNSGHEWLFCDTDLLVYQVWMEVRFGFCPDWIMEEIGKADYAHRLLLRPDLPWEDDGLRENALNRDELFERYRIILLESSNKWSIIEGEKRLEEAKCMLNKIH